MEKNKGYKYAKSAMNRGVAAPKSVIKRCEVFLRICDGKSEKYFFDERKMQQIENILKLLIMLRGLKAGASVYECSCWYQYLTALIYQHSLI